MKTKSLILLSICCFSLISFSQNDSLKINQKFNSKGISELDRIATKAVNDIKEFFRGKNRTFGYKIGTNKHEKVIKKQNIPSDYISTRPIINSSQNNFKNFETEKNINPELNLKVTYPRITPSKGYVSFQVGDFNYKRYLNDLNSDNIEHIKLISYPDSTSCIVEKYRLLEKRKLNRHFSFVLDHSGSMGDNRASMLQNAVYKAIKNDFNQNKNTYSIHKFDGEGNIKHLITTKSLDKVEDVLLPTKGLLGFGHSTAIKDALVQAIDSLSKDNYSESKIIILFTDGHSNTDYTSLEISDIVRKAIDNNINIVPVGFGNYFAENVLSSIAYYSGGGFYKIYHENEFDQLFENIITDVELSYEIEFSPCIFGEEIEVEIKIKGLEKPLVASSWFSTPIKSGYSIDLNLLFKTGSDIIDKKKYSDGLKQVIKVLKENPGIELLIEGHTDKVGGERYNIDLSLKRAKAVKKYFIQQGISEERLEAKGLGWSVAAYPYFGKKKENALNRRIEIKIK